MNNIVENTLDANFNNWHILSHQENNYQENNYFTYNENQDDDLDNGLLPQIWGPPTWKTLHFISFGYPMNPTKDDKIHYKMFFKMIGYVLPCKSCRSSYKKFIESGDTKMTDDVFKDRNSLTFWLYKIHEAVNKKIGISYGITYDDLVKTYGSYRAKCSNKNGQCSSANKEVQISHDDIVTQNIIQNVIPYNIAKCFKKYGKKRGVNDFDDLYQYKDLLEANGTDIWNKRNNECYAIIKYMKENNIPSLEQNGQYKGLPTIEELKLIARLSSNLQFDQLNKFVNKIKCPKVYKFVF